MQLTRLDSVVDRGGRRRRGPVVLPFLLSVAALAAGIFLFNLLRPTVQGTVVDAYTGQPLAGAALTLGERQAVTGRDGRFALDATHGPADLAVAAPDGYADGGRALPGGRQRGLTIALRPDTLGGTITRKGTGQPLAGVQIQAVNADRQASTYMETGADGRYLLKDIPEGARLIVVAAGYARQELDVGQHTTLDVQLRADVISGVVRGPDGQPVAGATVSMTGLATTTQADGSYTLTGIPDDPHLIVKKSGYAPQRIDIGAKLREDVTLAPLIVRAVYLTPDAAADDAKFNALVALADRTEINAMVIDVKDSTGNVFFDSQTPLARQIGAIHPAYDVHQRLQVLKEHHIYAIARQVIMQDPHLAAARPDLAIHDTRTGGVWKDAIGVAWLNAMQPGVWQYNTDLAVEEARLGFDEVQFDYMRFPSDGDLDAIDLGAPNTLANRTKAIHDFLATAHAALSPLGVALGADIFGISLWDHNDNGIGQQLEDIAPVVDYICPMVYPSHFAPGSMGYDIPNDHPYDVILKSLQAGQDRVTDPKLKFRPWLQDFSLGPGIKYGPDQVRAQIQATYDFGATGWMLWNADSTFTEAALQPGQP